MIESDIWKTLESIDDEFLDDSDKRVFEQYLRKPGSVLLEMANVRGNDVKTDYRLPFSFYFSDHLAVHNVHGIRVKILWNPSKAPADADGYLELHGDYIYISGSHKYKPTEKDLGIARSFFKKYKVLFAAVWENKLDCNALVDYFRGRIQLRELLTLFEDIKERDFYNINHCKSLQELEDCVRKYKIFNMND